jgi:thymidylate kinase
MDTKRGLFIVFEGANYMGKSFLIDHFISKYKNIIRMKVYKFPNRTTITGKQIDDFLKNKFEFNSIDEKIKLFADNREEQRENILNDINSGISVLCDRYIYSGIVYPLTEYCNKPLNLNNYSDIGYIENIISYDQYMPRPDIVFLIHSTFLRNEDERYHKFNKDLILSNFIMILEYTSTNYMIVNNKIDKLDDTISELYNYIITYDINQTIQYFI